MEKASTLNKIISWGLVGLISLLPVFFLPLSGEFYEFNKNTLLIIGCLFLLVVWAARMVVEKEVRFRQTPFDFPIIFLALAFVFANLFASTNKIEALTLPGGTGTALALTLLYFLTTNSNLKINWVIYGLLASASLLSLTAVYQFLGAGELLVSSQSEWAFLRAKSWTPTGSLISLGSFLLIVLILLIPKLKKEWQEKNISPSVVIQGAAGLLVTAGLITVSYQLLTSARPILLPFKAAWFVGLEAVKRSPLWGVGPENYLVAFTLGKPIWLNNSNLWNIRFGIAPNYYLHILTTLGIFGLGTWGFLVWKIGKIWREFKAVGEPPLSGLGWAIIASLLLFFFFPGSVLSLACFFFLLGLWATNLVRLEVKVPSLTLGKILLGISLVFAGFGIYGAGRVWLADYYFRQSLKAFVQNRGLDVYNLQIKAISLNPWAENYRLSYSQTNFGLANALASNPKEGKLTDQDRQNISQLLSQAIREAKVAISLSPQKVTHWENLASLYQALINVAQDAESWAASSYLQAISLDPTNPILRVNLGGIFYALKNYDEAVRQFSLAVNLKPDYANAHYNLAAALKEKGQTAEAVRELEQTLSLVEFNSNDFKKVSQELEELKAKLPKEQKAASPSGQLETLTPPATPPAGLKPPIELPETAAPPVSSSPTPTPTPTPS